jgi:hypothetical protein
MNHLSNDYVMMLCRRDAISVPADEDIDDQRNMYCLYFIVIHIPSMEEIYVSRITSIEKVDMIVFEWSCIYEVLSTVLYSQQQSDGGKQQAILARSAMPGMIRHEDMGLFKR